jgi:hypothetical protein
VTSLQCCVRILVHTESRHIKSTRMTFNDSIVFIRYQYVIAKVWSRKAARPRHIDSGPHTRKTLSWHCFSCSTELRSRLPPSPRHKNSYRRPQSKAASKAASSRAVMPALVMAALVMARPLSCPCLFRAWRQQRHVTPVEELLAGFWGSRLCSGVCPAIVCIVVWRH